MEILEQLGREWVAGLSTVILTIVTAIYAFLTWSIAKSNSKMVDQIEQQTNALLRPVIGFHVVLRHGVVLALELKNSGKSTASDIELEIDKDFYQYSEFSPDRNIRNFNAFTKPIKSMAAGDKIVFDLSQGFNLNQMHDGKNLSPMEFAISIKYEFSGKKFEEQQYIDLKPYISSLAVKNPLEHLESIEKSLKKISSK